MTDGYYSSWFGHNKKRNEHASINNSFSLTDFPNAINKDMFIINLNQLGADKGYLYADGNASANGCGPVAVYNVMHSTGKDISFTDILYGIDMGTAGGGANILVMGEYLEDQGYKVSYLCQDEIDKRSQEYDAIIVTCTNTKFQGHYYTMIPLGIDNQDGEKLYQFYNGYGNCEDMIGTYQEGVVIPGQERNLNIHVAIAVKKFVPGKIEIETDMHYAEDMAEDGYTEVICYGIGFFRKQVRVKMERKLI